METNRLRARELGERYYETLLNSLTIDQLRTALFRLKRQDAPVVRSRTEAISAVESAGWVEKDLNAMLLDIEAATPTRHAVITKFSGSVPSFSDADLFNFLPASTGGLRFRPVFLTKSKDFYSFTFEHEVEVREWRDEEADVRRLFTTKIRHPIIARFYSSMEIAAFYFPGFSQGYSKTASERITYESVIASLTHALTYKFGSSFQQFPINNAIKFLQAGESPEIKIIRTDIDSGKGKVSLDSPHETNSVNDLLFSFIEPHVKTTVLSDLKRAIGSALDASHSENFVIYWCNERVVTRVRLWSYACEFMFVWNDTESSFRSIDSIIQLLVSVAGQSERPGSKNLWEFLLSTPKGSILSQNELITRSNTTVDEALSVAIRAVQAGILEYVFRLRTDKLIVECANLWRADPEFYRREFTATDGQAINGADPKMLEVGFARLSESEGVVGV